MPIVIAERGGMPDAVAVGTLAADAGTLAVFKAAEALVFCLLTTWTCFLGLRDAEVTAS
jgi:hypothetical protein